MTPLLIILADTQRFAQLLTLLDLRLRQLVHLVALQILRLGSTTTSTRLFCGKFLAQGIAAVVDLVGVESVGGFVRVQNVAWYM